MKAHGKWETELGHQILNWHKIYSSAYQCTSDTKLQDFQYRIINRILTTNASLLKFGLSDSEMCSFCHSRKESIYHLFAECTNVRPLWIAVEEWLNSVLNLRVPVHFSKSNIILGFQIPNSTLINLLTLLIKQYIYRTKFSNAQCSLEGVKAIIKHRFSIEKQIAKYSRNSQDKFFTKWAQLYYILNNWSYSCQQYIITYQYCNCIMHHVKANIMPVYGNLWNTSQSSYRMYDVRPEGCSYNPFRPKFRYIEYCTLWYVCVVYGKNKN